MKLSILFLLIFLSDIQTETIEEILNKFKTELDIYTVVVFGFNVTPEVWPKASNFLSNLPPQLVVTNENSTDLRKYLGERVLSLIFIDFCEESYLEEIVKPSLLNLHLRDVVFFTNSSLSSSLDPWKWLFNWCWLEGFWRVLLMNEFNEYLTMTPLPEMLIKPVSLAGYFKLRHQRFSNFHGYPLKVTVGNNPPRVTAFYDSAGDLQIGGFYGTIVQIFSSQYNATMDYVIMPDMSQYSVLSCIEYITERRADICTDAILFGNGIETTRPLMIVNGRLMVPFDTPLEMYNYFRKPYTNDVWLTIFVSFICTMLLLILVEYKEYHRLEFFRNLFITFHSFICASFNLNHLSLKYRYGLEALLIFSGFFLSNFYLAYLSSILLTKIYRRDIDSIRDVAEHNLTILTTDFHQFVLETSHASPLVRQQTVLVSEEELIGNLSELNPKYVYFDLDIRFDFYMYQQKFMSRPRMKKITSEVVTSDIGEVPMRAYWPFQNILMDFMDNLFCSGIVDKLTNEMLEYGISVGELKFIPNEELSVEPLSLAYFGLCGLILGAGYLFSIICFVAEIIVHNKCKRN